MGVRKTIESENNSNMAILKGRISFISDVSTYKIMGHNDSQEDIRDYNNFIYTSTDVKFNSMFGSPYKITIEPTTDCSQYRVNTINGATIDSLPNNDTPCVSIAFNRITGNDVSACENFQSSLVIIVPAGSPLVKTFGIGDYAKINISIASRREDALC